MSPVLGIHLAASSLGAPGCSAAAIQEGPFSSFRKGVPDMINVCTCDNIKQVFLIN